MKNTQFAFHIYISSLPEIGEKRFRGYSPKSLIFQGLSRGREVDVVSNKRNETPRSRGFDMKRRGKVARG